MKKKKYVVRVVQTQTPDGEQVNEGGVIDDAFLESLRYAGLVTLHNVEGGGLTVRCFDIHCPHGLDSQMWAQMNAERMKSFGFNAVDAPAAE